jgi:hypothetical protein
LVGVLVTTSIATAIGLVCFGAIIYYEGMYQTSMLLATQIPLEQTQANISDWDEVYLMLKQAASLESRKE